MPNLIRALILNKTPYGEHGVILRLLTREHGLMSVLLRGAFHKKKASPEIGTILEGLPIRRHNEGLWLWTKSETLQVYRFHNSLEAIALRDCCMELLLSILHEEDEQPHLYDTVCAFLHYLANNGEPLFAFWLLCIRLCSALGIALNLTYCLQCQSPLSHSTFIIEQGGFLCQKCSRIGDWPQELIFLLTKGNSDPKKLLDTYSAETKMKLTEQFIAYFTHHCGIKRKLRALVFFQSILR